MRDAQRAGPPTALSAREESPRSLWTQQGRLLPKPQNHLSMFSPRASAPKSPVDRGRAANQQVRGPHPIPPLRWRTCKMAANHHQSVRLRLRPLEPLPAPKPGIFSINSEWRAFSYCQAHRKDHPLCPANERTAPRLIRSLLISTESRRTTVPLTQLLCLSQPHKSFLDGAVGTCIG